MYLSPRILTIENRIARFSSGATNSSSIEAKYLKKYVAATIVVFIFLASLAVVYYGIMPRQSNFIINVIPETIRGDAIAGQMVVFLVTIESNDSSLNAGSQGATLSATATNAAILIQPPTIGMGQIAEVDVIPDISSVGTNVTVTINAERGALTQTRMINFSVVPGEDTRSAYAQQLRDLFVQWLQSSYPQLGITNQTQWQGTIVSPNWLVVSHYLFFSKNWEMHIYWHIMIPPYDWAKIDLRYRFNETAPSYSFEISSLVANISPVLISPPDSVWR